MKKLIRKQILPITIAQAWDFFSTPLNLNAITPKELTFEILGELPEKMYEGMFIRYKLTPILNIRLEWVTEITHIVPHRYFVDEQRLGPYQIWHHEHHFAEHPNGVLMTDILHYHIGKSVLGYLAGIGFVDAKVKQIFDYRFKILEQYFENTN